MLGDKLQMKRPPALKNEDLRLARLARLGLLDTEAEAVLDQFTELAAAVTGMPIALISLVDQDRQWWKSAVGLTQGGSTHRDFSFCGHAIAGDDLFEVEDARADERFADNPIVVGGPGVVHYAGVPLVMPDGERIGTICVIADTPGRLDGPTRELLRKIARSIVSVLVLRESERDGRERIKAELALRDSEAKFKIMTDAMPQMVWSTRADGLHDYFNRRWYEFTGAPEGSSLGVGWLGLFSPEDQLRAASTWQHSHATGEPYEVECRLRHRTGEYRWVLSRALPVRDETGAVFRWMGTCTDIHDQKVFQEELKAANRRKDEFLAMLAHELRNPLAPISSAAHTLELSAEDPSRVVHASKLINRQVKHMTALVDDLLDVSRVNRGLVRIADEVVEIAQVVQSALEQARPHMAERQHEISTHGLEQTARVRGDQVRLVQIVSNLLNNAAKYTPHGGHIMVTLKIQDDQACISVTDDGSGIEPDLQPHVFELFTQGARTPDRAQGGLGIGLALVKRVVELHGGTVRVESAGLGHGSTFTVSLPLTTAEPSRHSTEPAMPSAACRPRQLHIMVVDDNLDAALSLGQLLELEGHRVTVKTDAAQALLASEDDPAEVYLLDIGLPDMNGYTLAQRLNRQPGTRHAMLIAVTGYGQAEDVAQSLASGFHHHFVKPLEPARLLAAIAALNPVAA
jgi:PAS domain S-box-containing protein